MSIQDTVTTAMRNAGLTGYADRARPVVSALVEREQGIVEHIIDAAQGQGIDPGTVRTVLTQAGMEVPATTQGGTAQDQGDLARRVANLEQALEQARRQGYRV